MPSARSASARDAALGQQPLDLGAGEVRVEHEAGALPHERQVAGGGQLVAAAAVRRSCHTMARCSGAPVRRSHTTTVSRWLVMPIAATGLVELARTTLGQRRPHRVPDLVGVVLDPARAAGSAG